MSPAGLSVQLADILRDQLRAGDCAAGEMLPSEKVLMQEHDLARGTVRVALTALAREGLVVALPGRGWAVRKPS
jgi:DNA-binding GntR family transcriptional regulator